MNSEELQPSTGMDRRRFIAQTSAGAAGLAIVQPGAVFGASANSKIRLGMIGCGGRGNWIGDLFRKHGGYELVAGADYFQDRVDEFGERFGIPSNRLFTGLSCYKRLLDQANVDAVAIESPPYFHPDQAAAAVEAGAHVFLAKPIAVDAPGCRSIEASGKAASEKNLCFLVDFQTRANGLFQEAVKRTHRGDLGEWAFGEAIYHAGDPFKSKYKYWQADPIKAENRLRAWGLDRALSGDIIVEQNIHALDVMSWLMNEPPEYALGTGGRKARDVGTCWDHFAALYQYSNDVGVNFSSRQFEGHGSPGGIRNRLFGSGGVIETAYSGPVRIRGENPFEGGDTSGLFGSGAVNNIETFYRNVQESRFANETVAPSVRSNLVAVLGRDAAYRQAVVYWKAAAQSQEKLEANLKGLKD